jgi:hypothetical protein
VKLLFDAPQDLAIEAGERGSNVRHHVEHRCDSDESHRDAASKFKLIDSGRGSLVPTNRFDRAEMASSRRSRRCGVPRPPLLKRQCDWRSLGQEAR